MKPAASTGEVAATARRDRRHTAWALVIAGLFAVGSALSFAIDQSVRLSDLPLPQAGATTR